MGKAGGWKVGLAASLVVGVLVLDLSTKSWALRALAGGRTMEVLGGFVPLTLAFNLGAAFGIRIGPDPRWVFIPISVIAAGFLLILIRQASPGDHLRVVASSLVLGGALGNLYDRVRWDRGVVDFIGPIDLGVMLWPIFNVADMAITTGAVLLAVSFWKEEAELGRSGEGDPGAAAGAGQV
jgi:signal peptidase II